MTFSSCGGSRSKTSAILESGMPSATARRTWNKGASVSRSSHTWCTPSSRSSTAGHWVQSKWMACLSHSHSQAAEGSEIGGAGGVRENGLGWAAVGAWSTQFFGPGVEGLDYGFLDGDVLAGRERFDAGPLGLGNSDLDQVSFRLWHGYIPLPPPIPRGRVACRAGRREVVYFVVIAWILCFHAFHTFHTDNFHTCRRSIRGRETARDTHPLALPCLGLQGRVGRE